MSTTLIITGATMLVFLGLGLLVAEILARRPSRRRERVQGYDAPMVGEQRSAAGSEEAPC